jgi:hypothetical protein
LALFILTWVIAIPPNEDNKTLLKELPIVVPYPGYKLSISITIKLFSSLIILVVGKKSNTTYRDINPN